MNNATVSTYTLTTNTGRPIRQATKVTLPNGTEIAFTEKMGKAEAIRNALREIGAAAFNAGASRIPPAPSADAPVGSGWAAEAKAWLQGWDRAYLA